ncbi:hypothetical protein HDK77DRAFT_423752 [Phyllosticta capitalensis]
MVQELSPSVAHFCNSCHSTTSVPFSASVFSQNHACHHCGYISTGLGSARTANLEAQTATQPSNMQQDDLAEIFGQRLNISNLSPAPRVPAAVEQSTSQAQSEQGQSQQQNYPVQQSESIVSPQPIIYASTHYTHTSHVPRASSEPTPNTTAPFSPSAASTANNNYSADDSAAFERHSIDLSALSPGQLNLFRAASPDQQLRLLELWRITLPAATDDGVWTTATSLEQEEYLARERYERMIEERRVGRALGQMLPHPFAAHRQQEQQQQQPNLWEAQGGGMSQGQNQAQQNQGLAFGHEAPPQYQQQQQWQAGPGDMDMTDDDGTSASIMSSPRSIASPLPVPAHNTTNIGSGIQHHGLQYQFPQSQPQQQLHPSTAAHAQPGHSNAEPYMLSGYEMLAKREYDDGSAGKGVYVQSTDPVYKAAVENQYGAFQAVREYGGEPMGWFDDDMAM